MILQTSNSAAIKMQWLAESMGIRLSVFYKISEYYKEYGLNIHNVDKILYDNYLQPDNVWICLTSKHKDLSNFWKKYRKLYE